MRTLVEKRLEGLIDLVFSEPGRGAIVRWVLSPSEMNWLMRPSAAPLPAFVDVRRDGPLICGAPVIVDPRVEKMAVVVEQTVEAPE